MIVSQLNTTNIILFQQITSCTILDSTNLRLESFELTTLSLLELPSLPNDCCGFQLHRFVFITLSCIKQVDFSKLGFLDAKESIFKILRYSFDGQVSRHSVILLDS